MSAKMTSTILIGLDAFEREKLEVLMGAGRLPNLQRIVGSGFWTRLEPRPTGFQAMPWVSFLRGQSTADHGYYAHKSWQASAMRLEATLPDCRPGAAFWDNLDSTQHRIAVLDVPFAPRPDQMFNGVCLQGWQTHDQLQRYAHPKGLWQELRSRFGPPRLRRELCAPHNLTRLSALRRDMLTATEQFGHICSWLLRRERWDLFMAVFGTAHRTGHYLWDASQVAATHLDSAMGADLENAIDEVYCRCDSALGEVIEAAPADSRILVFALHGMRGETGWPEVFPRLLAQIKGIDAPLQGEAGMLLRLKQTLPSSLAQEIVRYLPQKINAAILPIWSRGMFDWQTVRCFPVPGGDSNSLLRINLKGREAGGIVAPGKEFEELCQTIEAGLMSFRDVETGETMVAKVERMDQVVDGYDPHHSSVPDIVVHWQQARAYETRGVTSPEHGDVRWDPGWRIPSGRSGDHSHRGWLAAAGPGIPNLRSNDTGDIADLAATILNWFPDGSEVRPEGRRIRELILE